MSSDGTGPVDGDGGWPGQSEEAAGSALRGCLGTKVHGAQEGLGRGQGPPWDLQDTEGPQEDLSEGKQGGQLVLLTAGALRTPCLRRPRRDVAPTLSRN